jgi:hypothetical protein
VSDRSPRGHGPQRIFNPNLSRPEPLQDTVSRRGWFDADFVVDRISQALLAAKVSLRRLDAYVAEQELDLLEFPAGFMTQAGARATHVVGAIFSSPHFEHPSFTTPQMTFGLKAAFPIR